MARKAKKGLGYFPMDIDIFSDLKIRKLIKYQGGKAITVYALLLCSIYKEGYYMRWDSELPFVCSELTGFDEAYISEVIKSCLALGLFSSEIFNRHKVLTSRGIQERYERICSQCRRVCDIDEYGLISSEEMPISSEEMPISSEEMPISSEEMPISSEEMPQSKVNKRKYIPPTPPKGGGGRNLKKPKPQKGLNYNARLLFEEHFRKTFSDSYYWTAKDAGAMTSLLNKLRFQREQKQMDISDDSLLYALQYLLSSIKEGWIFDNFSVTNINSKYNEIVAQAKKTFSSRNKADIGVILTDNSPDKYDNPNDKKWEERWNK